MNIRTLIVLIDMTEISNYIRNQFTEVHICKQGGCNYLENTCKVVVLLSRYVSSAHAVATNTLIDMTTRPNYQITEVHDCKVVGLNCRWPGDHLRDARWLVVQEEPRDPVSTD